MSTDSQINPEPSPLHKIRTLFDPTPHEHQAKLDHDPALSTIEAPISVAKKSLTVAIGSMEIPGYEILEELGRGSMGVVFKARQTRLNRIVALKMILDGEMASQNELDRFHYEAEAIAQLRHPYIVQIFEIGDYKGRPFFSLEYCEHGTLFSQQKEKAHLMQPREAALLLEKVAIAVAGAHEAGIIHRDLKPANILLLADGTPKVSDFGIAKKMDMAEGNTLSGTIIGTPVYMSPEQAAGRVKQISPVSDVYSLGAILYECLTGRPPIVGTTTIETLTLVQTQEPLPPRILNPKIGVDLEKVTLKCLEKDPANRYQSAIELADDLRRFQNNEPVAARTINIFERLQRGLAYSQHDSQLRPWGTGLIILGITHFFSHLITSMMLQSEWSETASFWFAAVPIVLVGAFLIIRSRRYIRFFPTNTVERLLWTLWSGYFVAFVMLYQVMSAMGHTRQELYGVYAVLSGFTWFILGGYVWGWCYLIGIVFMAMAPMLARMSGSPWTSFVFGCLWSVGLVIIGARYRFLGREQAA